jgi:uncharacterized iron-regulated membrane protein
VLGFFAAPVFMVLAVSGIYFNFPNRIIPAVKGVMVVSPKEKLFNKRPDGDAMISLLAAKSFAQRAYPNAEITRIALPSNGFMPYEVRVKQKGELQDSGTTRVTIDANSGKILRAIDPLQAPAGDVFLSWQFPLHSGQAFGTAGKIFISVFGVLPLLFFVTGLCIWIKRKK